MAKDNSVSRTELAVGTDNGTENHNRGYGWLFCRPNLLQSCLCPRWILVCCCLLIFTQSFIISGLSAVVVTSIERRYFLRSSQVGVIFASYDIGNTMFTIVVSYFGYRHKPKWLGIGSIVLGLGCLVFALPQLLVGDYEPVTAQTTDLCQNNRTLFNAINANEKDGKNFYWYNILVIVVGQVIIGAGSSPIFNLGSAYLDENASRENSGVYLGIYYAAAAIGSGIGFLLGGIFLAIYVDIVQVLFTVQILKIRARYWLLIF